MTRSAERRMVPLILTGGTALILASGAALFLHARGATNAVALAASPKGVTAVEARPATFRPTRRYIGTVEPWVEARVGPQLVSAYVDTVLVRPGMSVARGQVIATLDCRSASATSHSLSQQAHALESTEAAVANEAARLQGLLAGGYASPNEAEQKKAESESKQAQILALQAQVEGTTLQVGDCVLRAPFAGEIADRLADPGAFVRPGSAIATLIDRTLLRVTADVPEDDFDAVTPGTQLKLHLLATNRDVTVAITRRAPAADTSTRTVHIEADLSDPERRIPVGTTAEINLEVGEPTNVTELPLLAAVVKGSKASVFVVADGQVHSKTFAVKGEREGMLFLDSSLEPGSWVVTEGRAGLADGDHVVMKKETPRPRSPEAVVRTSQASLKTKRVQP